MFRGRISKCCKFSFIKIKTTDMGLSWEMLNKCAFALYREGIHGPKEGFHSSPSWWTNEFIVIYRSTENSCAYIPLRTSISCLILKSYRLVTHGGIRLPKDLLIWIFMTHMAQKETWIDLISGGCPVWLVTAL